METSLKIAIFACLFASTFAIQCYVCNSLTKPECEDKYESTARVCAVKSFGGQKAVKAVGCRVIRQYVNDEYSIDRTCAYTGENVEGKSNKGSLGVQRIYTQCSEDKCNSVGSFKLSTTLSVFTIFAFIKYVFA